MLPLGAGLVCCEEMVAAWRQREMMAVGLGRRGRVLHPCLPHPRVRTIFARGHIGIPETDGRKLGLSAGLGSWYEWGVMVGAREWRSRLSRGQDDDRHTVVTGRERDYRSNRTDSDDLTIWALRLGELGRET
jgi:hypothetical protein